ncbi:urease accessory protein UreE [Microvirga terrestris]|uniref:Urease accessory protein UreE n=1 Tax=Microvirga terrestris TaxID=2791024 RepID=A0ABS0HVD3_9HYPH|nr:urease accessory protein UreE [Microvirga terrestris]MBF9197319.1 urease accessory protein UreE [Microvirga terrestris]
MIRATFIIRRNAVDADRVVDVITLDHGDRHRRRIMLNADGGTAFLLDLDKADVLEDGDAIRLDSGWLVEVKAAPEKLIQISTEDPLDLLTLAWHIGNRHVPAEITNGAIYIAYDHVLLDMLQGLGARTEIVDRPFRPVRGAYHPHEYGGHSGHHHGHDHG